MDFDNLVATVRLDRGARHSTVWSERFRAAVDARGVTFLATDIAADGGKIILAGGIPQATGNDEEQMLLALREIVSSQMISRFRSASTGARCLPERSVRAIGAPYTVMGDTVNLAARLMAKAPVRPDPRHPRRARWLADALRNDANWSRFWSKARSCRCRPSPWVIRPAAAVRPISPPR